MSNNNINEAEFWKARFEHANAMHESCMSTLETLMDKIESKGEWVGLTDEEIGSICNENYIMLGAYAVDFMKAIEAKLKEKNT